ncbi:hypothetical protein [Frigidibacter sp. MR17.24]|uniref:hypothetical protein n=1 Tax=Frigidibacter sp. MR17.24 TaxID=3127345 RepID=UPI003012A02C
MRPSYALITCACGHRATVAMSRWLHRDEVLRRARCSVCGRRGAVDMIALTGVVGGSMGLRPAREVVGLPVIEV